MNKLAYIFSIFILGGCTQNLEKRVAILESNLYQIQNGMLANDKNIKSELYQLKEETEKKLNSLRQSSQGTSAEIREIRSKTDKFCVHSPDSNNLQIFPEGQCP